MFNAISILIKHWAELLGLKLLRFAGTDILVYPMHMKLYEAEIRQLCADEATKDYHTDDILGAGYFKGRRVMQMMKKRYPELSVRDLWQAVDICSRGM